MSKCQGCRYARRRASARGCRRLNRHARLRAYRRPSGSPSPTRSSRSCLSSSAATGAASKGRFSAVAQFHPEVDADLHEPPQRGMLFAVFLLMAVLAFFVCDELRPEYIRHRETGAIVESSGVGDAACGPNVLGGDSEDWRGCDLRYPKYLRVDIGSEFTSKIMQLCSEKHGVESSSSNPVSRLKCFHRVLQQPRSLRVSQRSVVPHVARRPTQGTRVDASVTRRMLTADSAIARRSPSRPTKRTSTGISGPMRDRDYWILADEIRDGCAEIRTLNARIDAIARYLRLSWLAWHLNS